jgi:hypothetical protein
VSIAGTAIFRWVLHCLLKISVLYGTDMPNINFHFGPHRVPSPVPKIRVRYLDYSVCQLISWIISRLIITYVFI